DGAVCRRRHATAAGTRRVRADQSAPGWRSSLGSAVARRGVRVRLGRTPRLPLVDLASSWKSRSRDARPRAAVDVSKQRAVTAGHFIFIPAVLLVGIVIGWILGSRAARDAYAAELRRREERAGRAGGARQSGS